MLKGKNTEPSEVGVWPPPWKRSRSGIACEETLLFKHGCFTCLPVLVGTFPLTHSKSPHSALLWSSCLHMQPLLMWLTRRLPLSFHRIPDVNSVCLGFFCLHPRTMAHKLMCNHMTGKCKGNTCFDRMRCAVLNARLLLNVTVAFAVSPTARKSTNGFYFIRLSSHVSV